MPIRVTPSILWSVACLLTLSCGLLALSWGSSDIQLQHLWSDNAELQRQAEWIILQYRLPRLLSAFVSGGLLALAGCCLQLLLHNPLAEPYILGLSGGASTFAILAVLLGLSGISIPIAAFSGAMAAMLLLMLISRQYFQQSQSHYLILCGVVLASTWGACITLLFSFLQAAQLQQLIFWLAGDFSNAQFPIWQSLLLLLCFVILMLRCNQLNALRFGQQQARLLGVPITALNWLLFIVASLATAAAISLGGAIGFVGLIIPHALRFCIGSDHRRLLPLSIVLGGSFLVMADTLSHNIYPPYQLPVGAITAIIGTPIFIVLLKSSWNKHHG